MPIFCEIRPKVTGPALVVEVFQYEESLKEKTNFIFLLRKM